jgi:ubiquinone/menaquinone biosynthesis C-methylase UbiE
MSELFRVLRPGGWAVDFAFANGVFEHIEPDDTDFLLQEFHRVLKPAEMRGFSKVICRRRHDARKATPLRVATHLRSARAFWASSLPG